MNYIITEKAKQSPILLQLATKEWVGVGGIYEVNNGARCASCNAQEQAAWDKANAGKEKRSYREALPHEYEILAEQYKGSGGIPQYLIIVPEKPEQKDKEVSDKK